MNEKLRCIIIDDEPIACEIIENYLAQIPFLERAATFTDAMDAFNYLQNQRVDIILSDIQMPKLNGMDLIKSLAQPLVVIFITAHRDFAIDGFDTGAVDYLLKPVRFERFLKSIHRAKEFIDFKQVSLPKQVFPAPDRIFIKAEGKLVKIMLEDLLYVEVQGDYLKLITATQSYSTLGTLKAMEEALRAPQFFRVQRSFMVQVAAIASINGNMIEINGTTITIAKDKKEELFALLGV